MIGRLLTTLTNKQHCLMESPTGTGKTLVLLCSALAWQHKSKLMSSPFISSRLKRQLADERREKLNMRPCSCGRRKNRTELDELKEAKENLKKGCKGDDLEDDCANFKSKKRQPEPIPLIKDTEEVDLTKEDDCDDDACIILDDEHDDGKREKPMCINCLAIEAEDRFSEILADSESTSDKDTFINTKIKKQIPRIFYGTRTHKQISQVVRELNKTPYKDETKMCILSSRDRTCVNDEVRELPTRNDRCKELTKHRTVGSRKPGETCPYYEDTKSNQNIFQTIYDEYKGKAWDIEDAANFGRQYNACPYFGMRSLQEEADITFSPYNYLLDPTIRTSLNINLKNSIVILDEAHNIEDICRTSASFVIDSRQIDEILDAIRMAASQFVQGSVIMDVHQYFRDKFLNLKSYLKNYPFPPIQPDSGGYLGKDVLLPEVLASELASIGLGSADFHLFKEQLAALKGDDEENSERDRESKQKKSENNLSALNGQQLQLLTQLTIALDFMFSSSGRYLNDYRGVITKSLQRSELNPTFNPRGRPHDPDSDEFHVWEFSLLCMNPSVAFEKIHKSAWAVIVASGTLSPIESLKSELGCEFPNVFAGAHVVPQERIFASILTAGPSNYTLNCAYMNSMKLEFQDEVGTILRDVCKSVPHGVLCFFPSYDRMENFNRRWMMKGIINEIRASGKRIFKEDKGSNATKFEKTLKDYNRCANTKGALLFAVFRGKVSEGIDFADRAARAVITIGIPYPNVKDIQVGLKREYNDVARRTKPHLMTGADWYASQAFRALNQALGRCIRHKLDWGAILMIDSRLGRDVKNISRWIQQVASMSTNYLQTHKNMMEFVAIRTREESTEEVADSGAIDNIEILDDF